MTDMVNAIGAIRTLDARVLSELALGLCLGGAVVVWVGIRFDRHVFRWAGLSVIVIGLVGLIFQNSLSRQTLAEEPASILPPVVQTTSPIMSPSPSPRPTHKPTHKPTKKPTKKPPPPTGGGSTGSGGFTPPPSKPPSQPPLPPVQGSPVPP
jgi:hypothetical protein